MNIPFIIGLIVVALTMIYATFLVFHNENKKPRNNVRFYLVKTNFMIFELFLGYPIKCNGSMGIYWTGNRVHIDIKDCGLNPNDYIDLDYDNPIEVFLNLED